MLVNKKLKMHHCLRLFPRSKQSFLYMLLQQYIEKLFQELSVGRNLAISYCQGLYYVREQLLSCTVQQVKDSIVSNNQSLGTLFLSNARSEEIYRLL